MAEPMRLQGGADLLKFLGPQADSISSIFDPFFHYFKCLTKINRRPEYSVADPVIFNGALTPKVRAQTYYLAIFFPKNCAKLNKIGRGGGGVSLATGIYHRSLLMDGTRCESTQFPLTKTPGV